MKLKKRKSLCAQCVSMPAKVSKKVVGMIIRSRKTMKNGVITVLEYFLFNNFLFNHTFLSFFHLFLDKNSSIFTSSISFHSLYSIYSIITSISRRLASTFVIIAELFHFSNFSLIKSSSSLYDYFKTYGTID